MGLPKPDSLSKIKRETDQTNAEGQDNYAMGKDIDRRNPQKSFYLEETTSFIHGRNYFVYEDTSHIKHRLK